MIAEKVAPENEAAVAATFNLHWYEHDWLRLRERQKKTFPIKNNQKGNKQQQQQSNKSSSENSIKSNGF